MFETRSTIFMLQKQINHALFCSYGTLNSMLEPLIGFLDHIVLRHILSTKEMIYSSLALPSSAPNHYPNSPPKKTLHNTILFARQKSEWRLCVSERKQSYTKAYENLIDGNKLQFECVLLNSFLDVDWVTIKNTVVYITKYKIKIHNQ